MSKITMDEAVAQLATCTGLKLKTLNQSIQTVQAGVGQFASLEQALKDGFTGEQQTIVNALNRLLSLIPEVPSNEAILSIAQTAISQWTTGADAALDTIQEIGDYLANNTDVRDGILQALGKRVAVDHQQNFTAEEEAMGRLNIKALGSVEGAQMIATAKDEAIAASETAIEDALVPIDESLDQHQALLDTLLSAYPAPAAVTTLGVYNNTTVLKTGKLATTAGAAYSATAPAGTQVTHAIRDTDFTLTSLPTDTAFDQADKGSLELVINGTTVDTFNLATPYDVTKKNTVQTYTPANGAAGKLTVVSVGVYNTFHTRGVARINIAGADLVSGHNEIKIVHTGITPVQTSAVFAVWFDTAAMTLAITGQTLALGTVNTIKRSGVTYATTGTEVTATLAAAGVVSNVYKDVPVSIAAMPGIAATTVGLSDASVSGLTSPVPAATETMTVTSKVLTVTVAGAATENLVGTVTAENAFVSTNATFPTSNIMIWTKNAARTGSKESFSDESWRLPTATDLTAAAAMTMPTTGNWDSNAALAAGELQVGVIANGKVGLKLARASYAAKLPTQVTDYSAMTGEGVAKYFFIPPSARGKCQVVIKGVTTAPSAYGTGLYNVRIALPSQTNMLDLGRGEDTMEAVTTENAGCSYAPATPGAGQVTLYANFKGRNTISSGNRIGVEITIRDASITHEDIEVLWN